MALGKPPLFFSSSSSKKESLSCRLCLSVEDIGIKKVGV